MTIDIKTFEADARFDLLHWEFGNFLVRRGKVPADDADAVELLGAKCMHAVEQGHSCLDLQKWRDLPTDLEDAQLPSPLTPDEWRAVVDKYPDIVGKIGDGNAEKCAPLLFDAAHELIYLNKYYRAEMYIANRLRDYVKAGMHDETVDDNEIHGINNLFQGKDFHDDPQQMAVAMALTHDFSILTGGPGTGKTTVLATILAMELKRDPQLRIGLAAPSGKAAMQMLDSLNEELSQHLVKKELTEEVENKLRALTSSTIHRMLGIGLNNAKPRFDENNPLPYDLIVIDECSMVSLRLMHQLCRAIPDGCRLLLIGDQNQLAAVEAGCLLGDFCSRGTLLDPASDKPSYRDHITRLTENHRSGIDGLKNFIKKINETAGNSGKVSASMDDEIKALYSGGNPNFRACGAPLKGNNNKERLADLEKRLEDAVKSMLSGGTLPPRFEDFFGKEKVANLRLSLENWRSLRHSSDEKDDIFRLALAHHYVESFRIICGIHEGLFGEINLNRLMSKVTGKKTGDDGFPVIIQKNDAKLGLNNGDVGICWGGRVYFPKWVRDQGDALIFDRSRSFNLLQLPEHGAAYAMTIHKSQGSGFDNVIMSLPEKANSVLCRELLYTGISRTKKKFLLWSPEDIFRATLDRECGRWSGMPYRLQKDS